MIMNILTHNDNNVRCLYNFIIGILYVEYIIGHPVAIIVVSIMTLVPWLVYKVDGIKITHFIYIF